MHPRSIYYYLRPSLLVHIDSSSSTYLLLLLSVQSLQLSFSPSSYVVSFNCPSHSTKFRQGFFFFSPATFSSLSPRRRKVLLCLELCWFSRLRLFTTAKKYLSFLIVKDLLLSILCVHQRGKATMTKHTKKKRGKSPLVRVCVWNVFKMAFFHAAL